MIVHPDFFDHWKTKALITSTGDHAAPLLILKLWCFCQKQQASVFEKTPNLKAICNSELSTEDLTKHFVDAGFVRFGDQGEFIVHDWERCNKTLRASWNNGAKGGRYVKNTIKPTGNPQGTRSQPASRARAEEVNRKEKAGFIEITHQPLVPSEERQANHKLIADHCRRLSDSLRKTGEE